MQGTRMAPSTQGGAREGRGQGERLMWLTTQRVFYAGLLGRAAVRTFRRVLTNWPGHRSPLAFLNTERSLNESPCW